jgi:hypothetical protein
MQYTNDPLNEINNKPIAVYLDDSGQEDCGKDLVVLNKGLQFEQFDSP